MHSLQDYSKGQITYFIFNFTTFSSLALSIQTHWPAPLGVHRTNVLTRVWTGTRRSCCWSGQEPDGGCSSDRFRPQVCPESSGPHSEDPRTFLHSELQVQAACALLPLQEYAWGTGGESTSVFFFLFRFFFSPFNFSQSSPVFGKWAETFSTFWWWTFDGYICRLLSAMMYLFWGGGGRQRLLCGRVISLVYRVNMLFIADVIIYSGRVLRNGKGLLTSGIRVGGEMCCQMDGTETSDTFSLFLY